MTNHFRVLLLLLLPAFLGCQPEVTLLSGPAPDPPAASPALAIEREVLRIAGESVLWPDFDPRDVPLAVYDGSRTFLFRHPAPPGGFIADSTAPSLAVMDGRHDAATANTNTAIGGAPTAMLLVESGPTARSVGELAAVAIHEAFHVHQRVRHPGWSGNEADLFTYPTDAPDGLTARRLETAALRRALQADAVDDAACWARRALAIRRERFAKLAPAFPAYERGTELNEGLASYVEGRAAGRTSLDVPGVGFGADQIRQRAYTTGAGLALLLDRFQPGWQQSFGAGDDAALDTALEQALGDGRRCDFDRDFVGTVADQARGDVAELVADRAARLRAFDARPGYRLVVEAGPGEPLWPQGFDPLNVQPLGSGQVLHARFLRLGNTAGQIEAFGVEALTRGAGAHPLFQGVDRVVLTGLEEPVVGSEGGKVTVTTTGVTLVFAKAAIERGDQLLTVRLTP